MVQIIRDSGAEGTGGRAFTRVNGVTLYYEVQGKGEPLLLIMGLGANTTGWSSQVPAFSREYQVIAFDNRGAGRSDKPNEPYSIGQMADDAHGLRSEEHTSELQSRSDLVCRLLLEKKKKTTQYRPSHC